MQQSNLPAIKLKRFAYEDYRETYEKQEQFLEHYQVCIRVNKAAALSNIKPSLVHKWYENDAFFRERFDIATAIANTAIEDEMIRRAVEGVEKPVYYRDRLVGTVREYSDSLLKTLAEGRMPERYGPKKDNGNKNHTVIILPSNSREFEIDDRDATRQEVPKEQFADVTLPKRDGENEDVQELDIE